MHDALADRTGIVYDPYTPEQRLDLRKKLDSFLECSEDKESDILDFSSVRQMREMCKQFKELIKEMKDSTERLVTAASTHNMMGLSGVMGRDSFPGVSGMGADNTRGGDSEMVGEEEMNQGFAVGLADNHSRPMTTNEKSRGQDDQSMMTGGGGQSGEISQHNMVHFDQARDGDANTQDPKPEAIQSFMSGPGQQLRKALNDLKRKMKDLKNEKRACARGINDAKKEIDSLEAKINEKSEGRKNESSSQHVIDGEEVMDEEEYKLLRNLKLVKKSYRAAYENMTKIRQDITDTEQEKLRLNGELSDELHRWMTVDVEDGLGTTTTHSQFDTLDDQEHFDMMEKSRVMDAEPDSLAFFQAQKTRRAHATQNGYALRQRHRNKRNS